MRRHEHLGDDDLLLAIDGELPPDRHAAIDAHTSACVACRARLSHIRATLTIASRLSQAGVGPFAPPSPDGRARLAQALRKAASERTPSWPARVRTAFAVPFDGAALAVAAALVLVITWGLGSDGVRPASFERPTQNRAPLPIAALTPGAVSSLTADQLCAGARPPKLVTVEARQRVVRDYGMERVAQHIYELDALITPELGGTADPENLWPQRYASPVWNARVKDELERLLPTLVCSHQVDLAEAQRAIAIDWIAAYQRYFHTAVPLRAHAGPAFEDDDDLQFAPAQHLVADAGTPAPFGIVLTRR